MWGSSLGLSQGLCDVLTAALLHALEPLASRLGSLDLHGMQMSSNIVAAMGSVLGVHTHTLCLPFIGDEHRILASILAALPHLAVVSLRKRRWTVHLASLVKSMAAACLSAQRHLVVQVELKHEGEGEAKKLDALATEWMRVV